MRIPGAHLRVQREHLGLSRPQLAAIWSISAGVIADWEDDRDRTPYDLQDRLDALLRTTNQHLNALTHHYKHGDTVLTYRTDADYRRHHPDGPYTASWHRALCARLLSTVPNLTVDFHRSC
jgi:hypothetical protein